MQRYFSNQKNNDILTLSKDDTYHIKSVMRMSKNDCIEVVYNEVMYVCSIIDFNPTVTAKILKENDEYNELKSNITIVQSLVKEQKMDYILQKATELGVNKIVPFEAIRSVVKKTKDDTKKIERWKKIVKEASEQSKRVVIPEISNIMSIKEIANLEGYDVKILCTVNETSQNLKKVLSNYNESDTMLFVIGPEGGFDPSEEKILMDNGFISTSLGKSVLRTETASSFIISAIRYIEME